jgi:predicted TIM-barrel fold metal-dependent hydrolase
MIRTTVLSFAVLASVAIVTPACKPPPGSEAPAKDEGKKKPKKDKKKDDAPKEEKRTDDGVIDGDQPDDWKAPKPITIDEARLLQDLKAENAELKRKMADGKSPRMTGIINAHEHLYHAKDLEKYLPAAREAGITATVFVASSALTLSGKGGSPGEPSMSENFENEIIPASKQYPNEVIPFATLDPKDPNKLETLKKHVAMGAKGLKLYSGHTNFYTLALDDKEMDPVYSYLEQTGLPILWHVHYPKYPDELDHVVEKHPKLNLLMPHYGVCFWRANDGCLDRLEKLMRAHKNIYVDTSLGTRQILTDGFAAMEPQLERYRKFITEFQDNITWGTDSVVTQNAEKTPAWFEKVMWAARDQLEKDSFSTELAAGYSKYQPKNRDGDGRFLGLNLPPEIVKKIYVDNPKRWLKMK